MRNNVKISRIKSSINQEQLAKKVGVTRQTIGLIEKGEYNPSLKLCISIAIELNKTLDELFWEVE
ncbi:helix-turn-helix transcriptional regulator [Saliterribacillus persicus]|uniref:helix-turn-helix transcriptional regulator n=1 Tax=Saliterribacillus persicus TaxID=930114 RepID=UPI000DF3AE80|nr:helix-turn-helix transcriptional regulator [Saliterribacillus persicus]